MGMRHTEVISHPAKDAQPREKPSPRSGEPSWRRAAADATMVPGGKPRPAHCSPDSLLRFVCTLAPGPDKRGLKLSIRSDPPVRLPRRLWRLTLPFLIWLLGLVTICKWLPPGRETLPYDSTDYILGFRSGSHELVSITGQREKPPVSLGGMPIFEYRGPIRIHDLDSGLIRYIPLPADSIAVSPQLFKEADLVCAERGQFALAIDFLALRDGSRLPSITVGGFSWYVNNVTCPDGLTLCRQEPREGNAGPPYRLTGYEIASGRKLYSKTYQQLRFSTDGKVAAIIPWSGQGPPANEARGFDVGRIEIFETRTGRTLASLETAGLADISNDGSLILDRAGDVWEIATGKKRFRSSRFSFFVLQGRALAETHGLFARRLLTIRDAQTGAALH